MSKFEECFRMKTSNPPAKQLALYVVEYEMNRPLVGEEMTVNADRQNPQILE